MASLTEQQKRELLKARKRAEDSIARVAKAEEREQAWADLHDVEPFPVEGHVEVDANLVLAAVNAIQQSESIDAETSEVVGVFQKSMTRAAGRKVIIYSRQLLLILNAAGVAAVPAAQNIAPAPAAPPPVEG